MLDECNKLHCADCCHSKTTGTFCGYSGLDCDIHGSTEALPLGYADTCSDFKSWSEFYHERRLKGCVVYDEGCSVHM